MSSNDPIKPAESNIIKAFVQKDLDLFLVLFNPAAEGARPNFKTIDGGDAIFTDNMTGFDINGESDLDLQYSLT